MKIHHLTSEFQIDIFILLYNKIDSHLDFKNSLNQVLLALFTIFQLEAQMDRLTESHMSLYFLNTLIFSALHLQQTLRFILHSKI